MMHTSTLGGNPLACTAGLAAVSVVQDENLVARSRDRCALMLRPLREMQNRHPDFIVDVRGKGLLIGVESATDEACELTVGQMLKEACARPTP